MNFEKKVVILCLVVLAAVGLALYVHKVNVEDRKLAIQTDLALEAKQAEWTGKYLDLREFNVRLPILEGMEDITAKHYYKMEKGYNIDQFSFSSGDLIAEVQKTGQDLACIEGDYTFGVVTRFPAVYPDGDDRPLREGIYVLDNSFIAYEHPQDSCTTNKATQDLITKKLLLIQNSFTGAMGNKGVPLERVQQGEIKGSFLIEDESKRSDFKVCAVLEDKSKSYCQSAQYEDPEYKYGAGFWLTVPAGKYQVYITAAEDPRDVKAEKFYYKADDKAISTIEVMDKAVLKDINPVIAE